MAYFRMLSKRVNCMRSLSLLRANVRSSHSACINEWKLVNFFTLTKRSTSAMHAIRVCPARNSKHVYKLYTVSKPK